MQNAARLLHTRDGSRVGNAIAYGMEFSRYQPDTVLFLIETDFGNRMRLTLNEVLEFYTLGSLTDYAKWRKDRSELLRT